MPVFVVNYHYIEPVSARDAVRVEHRRHLDRLTSTGQLLLGGPCPDANSGTLLLQSADRPTLDEVLNQDPYLQQRLVDRVEVHAWRPRVGTLAVALHQSTSEPGAEPS